MAKTRSGKLGLVLVVVLFCACGVERPPPPDVLRIHMGGEPATLNPILASDAYASQVNAYLFDSLIEMDPDTLEYRPKLATRWEISPDHLIYTFYLRKDVKWHDGLPLTADDVVYTLNLINDPKTKAPHIKVYYKNITTIRKIDDYTVQFVYDEVYFKGISLCGGMQILPKHILEREPDLEHSLYSRAPVGSGPYRFVTWETNKQIRIVRNEDYWGTKPAVRRIDFKLIQDSSIGLQILKKGLVDYYELRTIQWVKQTASKKFDRMFRKLAYPDTMYSYIGWNLKSPFFSDKRVRRAMTLSIDRELIKEKLQFGLAQIMTGPFFPYGKQNNPNIKPLPYDTGKARKLLAEAGWKDSNADGWLDKDGKKFSFEFMYSAGSKFAERLATIMKEDLQKIGVEMKIVRLEWAAFLDRIYKKDFDAITLAWVSPPESDPYQLWHSSQATAVGSSNFISFANRRVDWLIERARRDFDEDRRNAYFHRFHEIIDEEQPYTFLLTSPKLVAISRRFGNVKVHKLGLDLLEWQPAQLVEE